MSALLLLDKKTIEIELGKLFSQGNQLILFALELINE